MMPCRGRARWVGALLALSAIEILTGCGFGENVPQQPPAALRVPLDRDLLTLDPARGDDINTYNVVRQLYEGLVDYDPATMQVVPRIASSWTISPDGLLWTFEIRRGVRFIDDPCFPSGRGRELTAQDVKYSIERGLTVSRGARSPTGLPPIAGLPWFLDGREDRLRGVTAESSSTVSVRLLRPDATLPYFLIRSVCRVVPREAVEAYGDDLGVHPVGTGPFRLVFWDALAGVLLARNREYWQHDADGARLPHLDSVHLIPIRSDERNRLYAEGKIDMVPGERGMIDPASAVSDSGPTGGQLAGQRTERTRVQGGGGGRERETIRSRREQHFSINRLNTIYIRFDYRSRHPAISSRRLRLALSYALPRLSGTARIAARGLFPPGLPGFDPQSIGQQTDPIRASALLREAGYPEGRGLPEIRLAWRDWDSGTAREVTSGLQRLGLRVGLKIYGDREYWPAVEAGGADLFRDGWMADYPDPQTFLGLFVSGSPEDRGGFSDAAFNRLHEQFQTEKEPGKRVELARTLERMLLDDVAALFLHHERQSQFVSPRVDNWKDTCTNPLNLCFYETMRMVPAGG